MGTIISMSDTTACMPLSWLNDEGYIALCESDFVVVPAGIKATVRDNPCFAICRSQQDVQIEGAWKRLIPEARDSHWMMVYGDYLREAGYAARKIGLTWDNISDADA